MVTTRLGLAVRVKTTDFEEVVKLVPPENYTKFLGEKRDVSGPPLSWGPDAETDFLEPCKNLSARLQTYLGCESVETGNEHKTATRIRPGSDQAYCHAESKT